MKLRRAHQLISSTFASFAILVTILRYRRRLRSLISNLSRPIHAVFLSIKILTLLAEDTHSFLTTSTLTSPPRSIQKLLQLAASNDGQSVIRAITTQHVSSSSSTAYENNNNIDINKLLSKVIIPSLASSHGRIITATIVSTATREIIKCMNENTKNVINLNSNDIINTVTSDQSRKLIVDVAQIITATAVPQILRYNQHQHSTPTYSSTSLSSLKQHSYNNSSASANNKIPSSSSAISSTSKRLSMSSISSSSTSSTTSNINNNDKSTAKFVDKFVSKSKSANFWQQLAIIAIKDRTLVQDVIRIIVTQAVRTYLLTRAELNGEKVNSIASNLSSSSSLPNQQQTIPSSSSKRNLRNDANERDVSNNNNNNNNNSDTNSTNNNISNFTLSSSSPVWKILAKTIAVDFRRIMYSIGTKQTSTAYSGWTVF